MTTAIDLFAGAGGFSTGARQAGVRVLWAGNHWKPAVMAHQENHPTTQHALQDLHQANWHDVPAHDLLLGSPSCTGHSPSRGRDKPHHDDARSTAWAVVSCAEVHRPKAMLIENVPHFLSWTLYPAFKLALEALGYALAPHIIDAADCGVPQNRERLIIAATRSKAPIELKLRKEQHQPAGNIIDFNDGRWAKIDKPGRSEATIDRALSGRARFGDRFVMPYYSSGSGKTGRALERPLGTVTTRDRWAVVDGETMRMLTIAEYKKAMSFPADYKLPGTSKKLDLHLLGNAVPPLMAERVIDALLKAA